MTCEKGRTDAERSDSIEARTNQFGCIFYILAQDLAVPFPKVHLKGTYCLPLTINKPKKRESKEDNIV
jgi:hypothetical protein